MIFGFGRSRASGGPKDAAAPSRAGTATFFAGCVCSGALVLPYPAILVADAMALGSGYGGWSQCWSSASMFFGICLPGGGVRGAGGALAPRTPGQDHGWKPA